MNEAVDELLLTPEGRSKIQTELDDLRMVRRREVAARIRQALEHGDISENSEYDDAKNEQAFIEGRIANLERILKVARVVDESEADGEEVIVGACVRLRDLDSGETCAFTVVGSSEADPSVNKISYESPVGRAVLGQQCGAVVEVQAPIGLLRYELLKVSVGGRGTDGE